MPMEIRVTDEFFKEDYQKYKDIKVLENNWIQADSLDSLINSYAFAYIREVGEGISRKDLIKRLVETEVFKETDTGQGVLNNGEYLLFLNNFPEYFICYFLWAFTERNGEDVAVFELYGDKI